MKNDKNTRNFIENYPRICYKIKIISMFDDYKELGYFTIKTRNFMNSIIPGDTLLFEYPAWFINRSTGGISVFSVYVTNLRTNNTVSIKSSFLMYVYSSIEEYIEI